VKPIVKAEASRRDIARRRWLDDTEVQLSYAFSQKHRARRGVIIGAERLAVHVRMHDTNELLRVDRRALEQIT